MSRLESLNCVGEAEVGACSCKTVTKRYQKSTWVRSSSVYATQGMQIIGHVKLLDARSQMAESEENGKNQGQSQDQGLQSRARTRNEHHCSRPVEVVEGILHY
jgi:hypothetical protein